MIYIYIGPYWTSPDIIGRANSALARHLVGFQNPYPHKYPHLHLVDTIERAFVLFIDIFEHMLLLLHLKRYRSTMVANNHYL